MSKVEEAIQHSDTLKNMGLKVLEETPNTLKIEMPKEGNSNHVGGVYAGAIFTLAEFPFGMLCLLKFGMSRIVPVVGEVTIRYLAPAYGPVTVELHVPDEEWLQIERDTIANGKCKVVRQIDIKDENGNVNAIAKATYFTLLVDKKKKK